MAAKIDQKSMQNRYKKKHIFLINLQLRFDTELGAKMDEKSVQKRCQKRVGNDLAVNLKKGKKNDTPLSVFGGFPSDAGCKVLSRDSIF